MSDTYDLSRPLGPDATARQYELRACYKFVESETKSWRDAHYETAHEYAEARVAEVNARLAAVTAERDRLRELVGTLVPVIRRHLPVPGEDPNETRRLTVGEWDALLSRIEEYEESAALAAEEARRD